MKKRLLLGLVFIFLSALALEAQDVDVPGNLTMVDSTATTGNILKGGVPFIHNFGTGNTFLGSNAGNLTMTGVGNTAGGFEALFRNTIGTFNTASGANALLNNTTGFANTASGFQALQSNTTGGFNTASGAGALLYNTTGDDNTASGREALSENTTGAKNTAAGTNALRANTTGGFNTASGAGALASNTTGDFNTAIGRNADVAFGDLTNAIAIGADAIVDDSNKIRLGNSAVTVIEAQVGLTVVSDRNQKENFQPVEGEEVLKKIRGLSLMSWNFLRQDPKQFRHYGPMAQDFFAAFGHDGIGTIGSPTTITSTDLEGILMVSVQALEKRTVELRQEKERLTEAVEALKGELQAQRQHREIEQREQTAQIAELQGQLAVIAGRLKRLDRQELAAVTRGRQR